MMYASVASSGVVSQLKGLINMFQHWEAFVC